MRIPIDHQSSTPLYQQIEAYLRQNILAGNLSPSTRLPSTRQLAQDAGVSRITVKNAYEILESDGLIASREGSGTYVVPQEALLTGNSLAAAWPLWQQELAGLDLLAGEVDLPGQTGTRLHPQPVRFTGVGDPHRFPLKDFYRSMKTVIHRDGIAALDYGPFGSGYRPLRETISHVLASQGVQAHPDQVLITSGSQQAMALVCQSLLRPGDVVLVESPTYNFGLDLFHSLHLKTLGVPVDEHGLQVELIEPLLQQYHPRLIYTIPNFQNPSGACLNGVRRRQLVALADRYNLPILEDDFVGDLRYDGRAQPALKALDPGGRVIYISTFSKMLMPGLRVGFLVADGPVFQRLVEAKLVNDLATSAFMQRVLDEYVTVGRYQAHLRRSCQVYRQRRDAMSAALKRYLPGDVRYILPQGGLFFWLHLPEGVSATELLPLALEEGVDFTPGERFFSDHADGQAYIRLNFATQPVEQIEIGVRRLGAAFARLKEKLP